MNDLGKWITIKTVHGNVGCIRESKIMSVRITTCDDPSHPLHYLIDCPGGVFDVSRSEFIRVCQEIGLTAVIEVMHEEKQPVSNTALN